MAEFQQYVFQQGRRVGQIDLTEANAWESLSNTMSNFTSTIAQGQKAANVQNDKDVREYTNSQEDDIITGIGQISIDNDSDYAIFTEKAEAFKKTKLDIMSKDDTLGPEYAKAFGQMIDDKKAQYGQSVYRKEAGIKKEEQLQSDLNNIEVHATDTEHIIGEAINTWHEQPNERGGYAETLGPLLQTQREMFDGKLDGLIQLGVSGSTVFSKEQVILERFYKTAVMTEIGINIKNGEGKDALDEFNRDPAKFFKKREHLQALFPGVKVSLSDEFKNTIVSKLQTSLNQYDTAIETELKVRTEEAKNSLADFNSIIEQGHMPDAEVLDTAIIAAQDTEHYNDLMGVKMFAQSYVPFIAMNTEAQANAIAQAKSKKNMSVEEAEVWKKLEEVHNSTVEEAKTNGLELYFKQGLNNEQPFPELNFDLLSGTKVVDGKLIDKSDFEKQSNRDELTQQFQNNLMFSEKASAHYGVKVPPLTQTQSKSLLHSIKEGSRDDVMAYMNTITNGFGINTPDAMQAIFKDDVTAYTAIGGMTIINTNHSKEVADNMLRGIDAIKNNEAIIAKDFNLRISELIGDTYYSAEMPEQHQIVVNGAKALYAQYMVDAGKYGDLTDNITDTDILEKALKDFTGGYADMESQGTNLFGDDVYRIELPSNTEIGQVESWMGNITPEDVDAMGGVRDMNSKDAAEIINSGYVQLISMGDGRYAVKTAREQSATMIDPRTNKPFILDYRIGKHYDSIIGIDYETTESKIRNKPEPKTEKKQTKGNKISDSKTEEGDTDYQGNLIDTDFDGNPVPYFEDADIRTSQYNHGKGINTKGIK